MKDFLLLKLWNWSKSEELNLVINSGGLICHRVDNSELIKCMTFWCPLKSEKNGPLNFLIITNAEVKVIGPSGTFHSWSTSGLRELWACAVEYPLWRHQSWLGLSQEHLGEWISSIWYLYWFTVEAGCERRSIHSCVHSTLVPYRVSDLFLALGAEDTVMTRQGCMFSLREMLVLGVEWLGQVRQL